MKPMKFFLDTHDQRSSTFPGGISPEQFAEFFAKYEKGSRVALTKRSSGRDCEP